MTNGVHSGRLDFAGRWRMASWRRERPLERRPLKSHEFFKTLSEALQALDLLKIEPRFIPRDVLTSSLKVVGTVVGTDGAQLMAERLRC
jgi:hypothetical protein